MTRIKICGITSLEDAQLALAAGADALGFVFAPSPRQVDMETARSISASIPPFVTRIGVFVDAELDVMLQTAATVGLDRVQLHGGEPPSICSQLDRPAIKRIPVGPADTTEALAQRIRRYPEAAPLIDPGAGSGKTFPWTLARNLGDKVIVAGGLKPANVGEAIATCRPYAVDVASGVEQQPGKKSLTLLQAFVDAVRKADACISEKHS